MPMHAERRKYQRCHSIICKAQMSVDEKRWVNIELVDLSAGGLSFTSPDSRLGDGIRIFFNLYVYNMLSEFNIKMEGNIIRIDNSNTKRVYSVKFENINKYQQIQLDELIKSKITLCDVKKDSHLESENTTPFPTMRKKNNSIRLWNYK